MPRSTITHGSALGWEYRRGGYSLVANGTWYGRQAWEAWGPAGAVTETPRTYTKYSASVAKEIYLSLLTKVHVNAAWFGGRDLDRFSTYQFGLFDDTRIHGVPAAGVRFDELAMVRGSYSFNIFEQYRLDSLPRSRLGPAARHRRHRLGRHHRHRRAVQPARAVEHHSPRRDRQELPRAALPRERLGRRADPVPQAAQGQVEIGPRRLGRR